MSLSNCPKCNTLMKTGQERVGTDGAGNAVYHLFGYCDICKAKYDLDIMNRQQGAQPPIRVQATLSPQKPSSGRIAAGVFLLVFGIIVFFISLALILGDDKKPEKVGNISTSVETAAQSDPSSTEAEDEETFFTKGEIAELNQVQVTLIDYKESTGSDWNKPTDGNIFLIAEFEIANNTEKELAISSLMCFNAYADDYSLNYSLSALLEKEGNQLDGSVAAGKKMKGWIGWEVPQDYHTVEIHFTDNVWRNNKFVFLIEK